MSAALLDDLVRRCAEAFDADDRAEALRIAREAQAVAQDLIRRRGAGIPLPPDPTTAAVRDALVVALGDLTAGRAGGLVAADLRRRLELVAA